MKNHESVSKKKGKFFFRQTQDEVKCFPSKHPATSSSPDSELVTLMSFLTDDVEAVRRCYDEWKTLRGKTLTVTYNG